MEDRKWEPWSPREVLRSAPRGTWTLCALGIVGLAAVWWLGSREGIPFSDLSRDPLAVARLPFYVGLLSNLGVMLWVAAGAVAVFASAAVRRRGDADAGFLLGLGLISLYLGLDDVYMLHEHVYPHHLGLRERYVLPGYVALILGYFVLQRRRVFVGRLLPLFLAVTFFSLSLAFDKLHAEQAALHHLLEDGSKLLGILCWTLFLWGTSLDRLVTLHA